MIIFVIIRLLLVMLIFVRSYTCTPSPYDCEVYNSSFTLDFNNCSAIKIRSKNYDIFEKVNISARQNFSLEGDISGTSIMCYNNSGFVISDVATVFIANIRFHQCGISQECNQGTEFVGALVLLGCHSVHITNSTVSGSSGTGLILLNCLGSIDLDGNDFDSNILDTGGGGSGGGGGLYIKQFNSNCSSNITVTNTNFSNNRAVAGSSQDGRDQSFSGGMTISLNNTSQKIVISLNNCHFFNNSAPRGGGVQIITMKSRSSIVMNSLFFTGNGAQKGGGGLYIDVGDVHTSSSIDISETLFDGNNATNGGGAALTFSGGKIEFINCIWKKNTAHYGSAMDIFQAKSEGISTEVPILSCSGKSTFIGNVNWNIQVNETVYKRGFGVIMITGFKIAFSGMVEFKDNNGSCIYAIGSQLVFQENSNSTFVSNFAENGAGIALIGLSVLLADDKTTFLFCNNSVERFGAGIYYHSVDKHRYVGTDRFFFQALKPNSDITFYFLGNMAPKDPRYRHKDVHEQALYSSASSLGGDNCRSTETFCLLREARSVIVRTTCNGNCDVKNCSDNNNNAVPIAENQTRFDISAVVYFIPGIVKVFCVTACSTHFRMSLDRSDGVSIPDAYEFVYKNFKLNGKPGSKATVMLHGQNYRDIHIKFEVHLVRCPPLYKLSKSNECQCYRNDEVYFSALFECSSNESDYYSSIKMGYWVGYDNSSDINGSKILMAYCPAGYCKFSNHSLFHLPFTYGKVEDALDKAVCNNRSGHLCGECIPGTTVYFHSRSFKCRNSRNCRWGPLLFVIAEILPVSFIFLALIFLNTSLTSGGIGGFVFFAQMYESINIKLQGFNSYNLRSNYNVFHNVIYQLFNFDFLEVDDMSFCLGKNITTLHILVLKYLVSLYAVVLIFITVLLIRFCGRFNCCKFKLGQVSFVKVISAFIVIVYSKCTSVSFNILWYQGLYHERVRSYAVVALQGNWEYFGKDHLPYAVLALLVILGFTLPLPLILLAYPLTNKVLSGLSFSEFFLVKFLSKKLPLHKLLPLFDSFQGAFKEEYRFFSGLYFLYRITILLCIFASHINLKYLLILMQLFSMLLFHTLAWPYKAKIHNIIHALLFANLAFITSLKLLMFITADFASPLMMNLIYAFEILLANLPIVVIAVYVSCKGVRKAYKWCKKRRGNTDDIDNVFLADNIREESINNYYYMDKIQ